MTAHVHPRRQDLSAVPPARQRPSLPPGVPPAAPAAAQRDRPSWPRQCRPYAVDTAHAAHVGHGHLAVAGRHDRPGTGLPADNITGVLAAADRSATPRRPTSAATCGAPWWPASSGSSPPASARGAWSQTLNTLLRMEHHEPSGMFYNWYDEQTGEVLHVLAGDTGDTRPPVPLERRQRLARRRAAGRALGGPRGGPLAGPALRPHALGHVLRPRRPRARGPDARRLLRRAAARPPTPPSRGNHIGVGPDVWYTTHHYDTIVSETRITSYLGILTGQVPPQHYFATWRTFPATLRLVLARDASRSGETRTYLGLDVFEGAYTYRGMHVVPGWGGSMFEELMPDVFVPEESWAPRLLGRQPPAARAGPARARPGRGRLRLLGLLARPATPSAATASTASTRSASTPRATSPTRRRPTTTPASATAAPRPNADADLRRRRGHPARLVPGDDARAPQAYANLARIQSELRRVWRRAASSTRWRCGSGHHRPPLPVPRPGHGHGRHRKCAGGQRAPPRIRHPRCRARAAPRHRHGGVRSRAGLTGPPPQGVDVSTMERQ